MKLWPMMLSVTSPTAQDGYNASLDEHWLFKNVPKMTLLVKPDPNDASYYDIKVIQCVATSAVGQTIRELQTEVDSYYNFFPIYASMGAPFTVGTTTTLEPMTIWIFP